MSYTGIYRLGSDPNAIGEARNAWRGAMYVWEDISKRYFNLSNFMFLPDADQSAIWNAFKHVQMPMHEIVVLASTWDRAIAKGSDITSVISAFRKYAVEHPQSNLGEQADLLEQANIKPKDFVAWEQTSVSGFWGQKWNEDKEGWDWYDPAEGNHHDICAVARKQTAATEEER